MPSLASLASNAAFCSRSFFGFQLLLKLIFGLVDDLTGSASLLWIERAEFFHLEGK